MRKKIMSIILAAAMVAGATPMAFADYSALKNKILAVKDLVPNTFNVANDGTLSRVNDFEVNTNMQIKQSSNSTYAENLEINATSATVDYQTIMDMAPVGEVYNGYKTLAKSILGATDDEIDNMPVKGYFDLKIAYPDSANYKANINDTDTAMTGFSDNGGNGLVANGIFKEEVERDLTNNTLTIHVEIADGVTGADLAGDIWKEIVFAHEGVDIKSEGKYTVSGTFDGKIFLGDADISSTKEYAQNQDTVAVIAFKAVQDTEYETGEAGGVSATVTLDKKSTDTGMGGGTVTKKVTAKFMDGDKQVDSKSYTLKNGKAVVDFETIDAPQTTDNKFFDGWYKDKECTEPVAAKEEITKDTVYYAKWIDTKHKISFVVDGQGASVNTGTTGSVIVEDDHVTIEGDNVTINLDDITVKDKKVIGWYLDEEHTIPVEGVYEVNGEITFYAVTEDIKLPGELEDGDATGEHYAYIIGYPEGDVRPTADITRAEVATIFFRLLTEASRTSNMTSENNFSDVDAGDWYNNAVSTMASMGIVTGYEDGTFRPDDAITRAEFAAIAARFADDDTTVQNIFADVEGHWSEHYVALANSLQWITGYEDGTFRPENEITRAEVMTIVNRVLKRRVTSDYLLEDAVYWVDNAESAWYYTEVMEATNSHKFERVAEGQLEEKWTAMLENRDWSELEK